MIATAPIAKRTGGRIRGLFFSSMRRNGLEPRWSALAGTAHAKMRGSTASDKVDAHSYGVRDVCASFITSRL
jgi:hypothetical protein